MKRLLQHLVNLFRLIFRIKVVVITCVIKHKGVITHIGGTDNDKSFFLPKDKLLVRLRAYERWGFSVKVRTKNKTKVQVVGHRYFRTVKDKNTLNDLGDLPSCQG